MSAEVVKQSKAESAAPSRPVVALRFVESVPFGGTEATFADLSPGKSNRVASARIEADGSVVAISSGQRSDGMLLERDWTDRVDNRKRTERVFVPWANIRAVIY